MTLTDKQFLLIPVAVAVYASFRIGHLSIPISNGLAYTMTLLPIVAGLFLITGYLLTRRDTTRPPVVVATNTLIFIYSTVVITLLGTHAAPTAGLDCGLRERWTNMFRHKEVESIHAIQEAFSCCGLMNSRDMAWPFPDKTHDAFSCEKTSGHMNGCLSAWKREEQRMAGLLMGMVGLVFIWQVSSAASINLFPLADTLFSLPYSPYQRSASPGSTRRIPTASPASSPTKSTATAVHDGPSTASQTSTDIKTA
jgi:hypothetical protein